MGTVKSTMWRQLILGSLAISAVAAAWPNLKEGACEEAVKCQPACSEPGNTECQCSGNETQIPINNRPQIVYLTFDDAFSALAEKDFYRPLFDGSLKNPNDCAIRATHFITHSYTDYSLVNQYWHMGHEMASHSITHRQGTSYWRDMSYEGWVDEMVGVRKMIGQFAAIDTCQVKGARAPYLQGGGDTMYQMLQEKGFTYDCTWPTRTYGYVDAEAGLFPYTLDYKSVQDCPIEPCPKCSHPGLWVQPMIDLEDEQLGVNPQFPDEGMPCSMLDACVIPQPPFTQQRVFDMLMKNFNRTYRGDYDDFGGWQDGNRAPWGLYMHAAWFFGDQKWHYDGYVQFLQEITNNERYPDVWVVPIVAGIEYMKSPLPQVVLQSMGKTAGPFKCNDIEDQTGLYDKLLYRCGNPLSCKFNVTLPDDNIFGQERYMKICSHKTDASGNDLGRQNCPDSDRYPWLGEENHCGGNVPCNDCQA